MKRLVIITVGKTHSGKTTFAKALEKELNNSLVIDQDNHAEFINAYYKPLIPQKGANTLKFVITQSIVDYAVQQTDYHLILCNSNRNRKGRLNLLRSFCEKGFNTVVVNFNIPDDILRKRIAVSHRSTSIFRTASTFEEVLNRQLDEQDVSDMMEPGENEANYLFNIKNSNEVQSVIKGITKIAKSLQKGRSL